MRHNDELANQTIISEGKHISTWFYGSNVPGKEPTPLLYLVAPRGYSPSSQMRPARTIPGSRRGVCRQRKAAPVTATPKDREPCDSRGHARFWERRSVIPSGRLDSREDEQR
jgi:hypothetical protein